jgi:glucosamine-6-phosphate deaminase
MNYKNTCSLIKKTVFDTPVSGAKWVANEIADLIRLKAVRNENCVLGLATGGTPIAVYNELINMHKNEGLSFSNVITFNLDEYYPIEPEDVQAYNYFMQENLFKHIDIPVENINIPKGNIPNNKIKEYCLEYEEKINKCGGIDIQLLGIGQTGHIGFNEPGSNLDSKTRFVELNGVTRTDAVTQFKAKELVPTHAITMGVDTIMKSKKIVLMAWGEKKANIVEKAINGVVTSEIPATFLQLHPDTLFVLDHSSSLVNS